MDEDEIAELLGQSVGEKEQTTQERYQTLLQSRIGTAPRTPTGTGKGFIERNLVDYPIDTETGTPAWVKFNVAVRETPEQRVNWLQNFYGPNVRVRLSDTKEPLIAARDPKSGELKEFTVNERKFSLSDLATVAGYGPEFLGEALSLYAGRKIPFVRRAPPALRDIITGSIGQEIGQEAKEIATEAIDKPGGSGLGEAFKKRLGMEQVKESAADIGINAALGGAMVLGGKALGRGISPFANQSPEAVQQLLREGQEFLKQVHGIDYPLSPAEMTGSAWLGRSEAALSKQPGSSGRFRKLTQEKLDAISRFYNRMLNVPETATPAERTALIPSEEAVGETATAAIREKLTPQQQAVRTARGEFEEAASRQAEAELAPTLATKQTGANIRTKALEERAKFQDEDRRLYEIVRGLPGGEDRIFKNSGLVADAKRIKGSMPPETEIITEPTGLFDPTTGSPITTTITKTEVAKPFVPSGVLDRLKHIIEHPNELRSLEDLKQMRTDVSNAIAEGEAIPGVKTHYLSQIRKAISDEMDRAVESLPDGRLKKAWQEANAYHKANVGRFEEGNIARLYRNREARSFVQDEDIVKNIGPSEYASFKNFLGATSPEFKQLQAAIRGEIYKSSLLPGTEMGPQLIDGRKLIDTISNFWRKNTEFADEVLGGKGFNLQRLGEAIATIGSQKGVKPINIDLKDFEDVLKSNKPIAPAVQKLVLEQGKLDKLYRSKLLKDIGESRLGDPDFNFDAGQFVNRFYDTASEKELRLIMDQLSDRPDVVDSLRQKLTERILYEAQRAAKSIDPVPLGRGELFRPASVTQLEKTFGTGEQRKKLEMMLGANRFRDLVELGKILRGGEVTEQAFLAAGGWSAGTQVANIFRNGPWSNLDDLAKQKLWALMFTAQPMRGWLSNTARTRAPAITTARNLLLFEPFVEGVINEFGASEGSNLLHYLHRLVQDREQQQGQNEEETPEQLLGLPPRR